MSGSFWNPAPQPAPKAEEPKQRTAADILQEMADTFRERNAVYKDNYKAVGATMAALFPDGVVLKTADDFNRWHLFELLIVKLSRFVNSGMKHGDSIHDAAIYAAMVESLTEPGSLAILGGSPPKSDARAIAEKIVADLADRRGLNHQWEQIDGTIQDEIICVWTDIIAGK